MTVQVLLATGNAHKLVELRAMLAREGVDIEVLGLSDVPPGPEPVENGRTFEDNALIKAREWCGRTGLACLADDSGLEIEVLNNCPGVRSARWAGPECDDDANLHLVLRQIDDVPDAARGGDFVCAIAFVHPDGTERVLRRTWPGRIAREPRGHNGFGYDPIFIPEGLDRTSAELSPEEKNERSHRGQALRAMIPVMAGLLGVPRPSDEEVPAVGRASSGEGER